ncbi:hypothetical protein C7S13_7459 [Burkholderia cepacia]|nr:hypothetical protein [Burkholderia cepacia]
MNDPVASGRRAIRVDFERIRIFHLINRLPRAEFCCRAIFSLLRHEYLSVAYLSSERSRIDSKQFAIITQIHQGAHSARPRHAATVRIGIRHIRPRRPRYDV